MARVVKYIQGTIGLPFILSIDKYGNIKWHVDEKFAVHEDMRVHTGGRLKMGQGFPILALSKQKLNTRSSIESEIFGFDQLMPLVHWTRNTLEPHGYVVTENIIYQDNKSAILLKNNGKSSISKRTKHINIRFFCNWQDSQSRYVSGMLPHRWNDQVFLD